MKIGGLQKMTLIDYPSKISATVFTCGCNFACPFCHNPELFNCPEYISEKDIFDFLKTRQGILDGICITGGEPTIHKDLPQFIKKIKDLGFLVKLDSNGSNPKMLEKLINQKLIDYISMDIKSSKEKYSQAAGTKVNIQDIIKSTELIRQSGLGYDFRTTVAPKLVTQEDIKKIGQWLKGSKLYALQQFRPDKTLDKSWGKIKPYSEDKLKQSQEVASKYFKKVELRGLK